MESEITEDEQRLLCGLFKSIPKVGHAPAFQAKALLPMLDRDRFSQEKVEHVKEGWGGLPSFGNFVAPPSFAAKSDQEHAENLRNEDYKEKVYRLDSAVRLLHGRKLIDFNYGTTSYSIYLLGLTVAGFDLGSKLSKPEPPVKKTPVEKPKDCPVLWLEKDERRLLAGYMLNLKKPGYREAFEKDRLAVLLEGWWASPKEVPGYFDNDKPPKPSIPPKPKGEYEQRVWVDDQTKANAKYGEDCRRIDLANQLMEARGLLIHTPHENNSNVALIELTFEGFELGRKYASLASWSNLWFQTHRATVAGIVLIAIAGWVGGRISKWADRMIDGVPPKQEAPAPQPAASPTPTASPVVSPSATPSPTASPTASPSAIPTGTAGPS